jgi:hypothetical protein
LLSFYAWAFFPFFQCIRWILSSQDAPGEYVLNETTAVLSAIFPDECIADGAVVCPTRVVPAPADKLCPTRAVTIRCPLLEINGATNVTVQGVDFTAANRWVTGIEVPLADLRGNTIGCRQL